MPPARVNPKFAHPDFLKRFAAVQALTAPPAEPLTKPSATRMTDVFRCQLPEFPGQPLIVKRYRPRFWFALKEFFRASRAQRAYALAEQLRGLQIATAEPIAAADVRRFGWLKECYFISAEVAGAERLRAVRARPQSGPYHRRLVRAFARLMAQIHNARLKHSDVTLSNFLVTHERPDRPQLVVIDLDALRPQRQLSLRSALEDLQTLMRRVPLSPREQLWFLAQYARRRTGRVAPRELARHLKIAIGGK